MCEDVYVLGRSTQNLSSCQNVPSRMKQVYRHNEENCSLHSSQSDFPLAEEDADPLTLNCLHQLQMRLDNRILPRIYHWISTGRSSVHYLELDIQPPTEMYPWNEIDMDLLELKCL